MTTRLKRWWVISITAVFVVIGTLSPSEHAQALDVGPGDGVLVYGQSSNTTPQWRTYGMLSNTFGSPQNAAAGSTARNMTTKTSPTKQEAITGYAGSDSILHIMCYNGTSWVEDWSVNVGGFGAQSRFDIAYEKTTGDAMVLYSRDTPTTNEMAYRTKPGSSDCGTANWSSATNIDPSQTDGTVVQIRLEGSKVSASNVIGAVWSDSNNKLSGMEWTGTAWNNTEPAAPLTTDLERFSAAGDESSFDIAMDSTSGNLMVVWGQYNAGGACTVGVNCIMYAQYTTSWQAVTAVPLAADEASSIDISAHPTSNEIVMAAIGNNENDLTTAYWSGSAWNTFANRDGSASGVTAGVKFVATGWLRSTSSTTTRAILVYADSTAPTTNISWNSYNGATNTNQTDFVPTPTPGGFRWMDIQTDPIVTDQLMLLFSDSNADLFAKRLTMDSSGNFTWSDADSQTALETNLGQTTNSPFGFAFWRYIPSIETVDIVNGSGTPVGSPSFDMSAVVAGNTCQTSSGSVGATGQRIRLTNTTANPAWTLSLAATAGIGGAWSSGTDTYDYNDPTGGSPGCSDGGDSDSLAGQLSVDPSAGSITPKSGCTSTGISLGSSSAFNQGTVDSITLMSASGSASTNCYWDLLGVNLSQAIPSFQAPGAYSLNMTMTVVAN